MTLGKLTASAAAFAAAALLCIPAGPARADQSWDELIAAARKEGKVVVIGPAHQDVRRILPVEFKKRFGVDMEYQGGRGGAAAEKLRAERQAGLYTTDVGLAGIQTLANDFYANKMLDPIKPILVHPDAVDGSKWRNGEPWFIDPEKMYALRLFSYVGEMFTINTSIVKPEDMKTARELLLNPKWRGKIAVHDPTRSGTGSNIASQMYVQLGGEAFLKAFYVDQKPVISHNERQLTDWALRGTYPIIVGGDFAEVEKMRKEGIPVMSAFNFPDLKASVSGGNGNIILFNRAPHPNAAKLLINWLASKEGLEVYARASHRATNRLDIDEKSFLEPESIPEPGVEYFDSYDWEFSVVTKAKVRTILRKLMGG